MEAKARLERDAARSVDADLRRLRDVVDARDPRAWHARMTALVEELEALNSLASITRDDKGLHLAAVRKARRELVSLLKEGSRTFHDLRGLSVNPTLLLLPDVF
ncbi:hypothetical protein [Streptosporangium carneum]|uniref:Uncharacterized protein n=1 Tax=Streptosporangium carneum TaxID=47481 RepID=A0A9W6MHN4_9ACTN|nr:hypothetical protein [Streptosporangium carneum]GLK14380.1 hypothetical protein GCM10017600_77920 [Streptosporangium carneum]